MVELIGDRERVGWMNDPTGTQLQDIGVLPPLLEIGRVTGTVTSQRDFPDQRDIIETI